MFVPLLCCPFCVWHACGPFRGPFHLNCPAQLNVQAFHGSEGGDAKAEEGVNVAVCTMEKANSIVNRLAEEGRLQVRIMPTNL